MYTELMSKEGVCLCKVGSGGDVAAATGPVGVDPLVTGQGLVGVGTEVISLGLEQVGGENGVAVAVKEGQGRGQGRDGDSQDNGLGNNVAPALGGILNSLGEEGVEKQVLEVGVLGVGSLDVTQEDGANDAAAAPHEGNAGVVQVPAVLLGSLAHEHEALGVRDDLGGVEGLGDIVDELLLVTSVLGVGSVEDMGGADTLTLDGGQAAGEDGLTDQGDGHAIVQGRDDSPLSSSLLLSESCKSDMRRGKREMRKKTVRIRISNEHFCFLFCCVVIFFSGQVDLFLLLVAIIDRSSLGRPGRGG